MNWISVEDRLPNFSGIFIAKSDLPERKEPPANVMDMLYGFSVDTKPNETQWQHSSGFCDNGITHWMGVPEIMGVE